MKVFLSADISCRRLRRESEKDAEGALEGFAVLKVT